MALFFLNRFPNNPFVGICWIDEKYNDLNMPILAARNHFLKSSLCGGPDFDTWRNKQLMCHYLPSTCSKLKQ
jgi:hypothetical protein